MGKLDASNFGTGINTTENIDWRKHKVNKVEFPRLWSKNSSEIKFNDQKKLWLILTVKSNCRLKFEKYRWAKAKWKIESKWV